MATPWCRWFPILVALSAAAQEPTPGTALAAASRLLTVAVDAGEIEVDYISVVNGTTMAPLPDDYTGPGLAVVAARVGTTRLIDNIELVFPGPEPP